MTDIIFEIKNRKGMITLNRPQALNALSLSMIISIEKQLQTWKSDVDAIIIQGNGEKAFCAGGDIRALYEYIASAQNNPGTFFIHEYTMNALIANYPKPYIAFMHGIVMGGGLGVSVYASHRIGMEKTILAMPETAIGFFPDIGASYFLSRCPGFLGLYLGLTGARMNAADGLYTGLLTHFIPTQEWNDLKTVLENAPISDRKSIDAILNQYAQTPEQTSLLEQHRSLIDHCFSASSVEDILLRLQNDGSEFAKETYNLLLKRSPTSLKVTFEQLHRGKKLSLIDCLQMEKNIAKHFLLSHDMQEGIRAVIIDKTNQPRWNPQTLAEVTPAIIESFFI